MAKTLEERVERVEKMLADILETSSGAPLDPNVVAAHERVKVAKDEIKEEHAPKP